MRVLEATGDSGAAGRHGLSYSVDGSGIQMVEIRLSPGASVFGEAGRMCWMRGVRMETSSMGVISGLARKLAGSSFFLSEFRGEGEGAIVAFSPKKLGSVVALEIENEEVFCEKDSFLAASAGAKVGAAIQQNFSAGLFGGDGFILQKIHGSGIVFLCGGGFLKPHLLGEGEHILVAAEHVALFEKSVSYTVANIPGLKNIFLGGEGLFIAKLTGPGNVWLQGSRIPAALPERKGKVKK